MGHQGRWLTTQRMTVVCTILEIESEILAAGSILPNRVNLSERVFWVQKPIDASDDGNNQGLPQLLYLRNSALHV